MAIPLLLSQLQGSADAQAQRLIDDYLTQHTPLLTEVLKLAEALGRSPAAEWLLTRKLPTHHPQSAVRIAQTLIKLAYLTAAEALLEEADGGYASLHRAAVHYWLGNFDSAATDAQRSYAIAKAERDLPLAIAALTLSGELYLAQHEAKRAVVTFGKALGLTEYSSDTRLTLLPLAGLGHAQHAWGYPEKASRTLHKALSRAQAHTHQLGLCRVQQALGFISKNAAAFSAACRHAEAAPHVPMWLQSHQLAQRAGIVLESALKAQKLAREVGMVQALGSADA